MRLGRNSIFMLFAVVVSLSSIATAQQPVTPREVESAIAANILRVPEFVFIRAEAEKLGVRAYLFGGTAAGYAHYVRNDLEREKGDARIQEARFDYDFTSIFRSTQDLDVVIDGPTDKIEHLREVLAQKYPHFVGGKAAKWELRSLRESKGKPGENGYKEALLDSLDFLNQNSDSNSTGLIEVTKPKAGESVVLDLRDRNGKPSQFLKDVANAEITFYQSATHAKTPRAAAGNNPEIFSVVRALTKAFQYGLKIRTEEMAEMKSIVDRFDPMTIKDKSNTERRLIEMGVKLFVHSVDVERAWNDLEALGLRQKLMTFDSPDVEGSLSWWMNKEPLRTKPIGQGTGRTAAEIAKELGLTEFTVAHETRSLIALETLERSPRGEPNFFESRQGGHEGETAAYGNGVYARVGRKGAVGSGLTVRMVIDPNAREGTDFEFAKGREEFVVIHNRAAARVINENYSLTLVEYMHVIATDPEFDLNETGLLEKLSRRIKNQINTLTEADHLAVAKMYRESPYKFRVISELLRLGVRLPITEANYEQMVQEKVDEVRALRKQYRGFINQGRNFEFDMDRLMKEADELGRVGRTLDVMIAVLEHGVKFGPGNHISWGNYPARRDALISRYFEKAWSMVKTVDDVKRLRNALDQSHMIGRFKERAAPLMKTAADLEWLRFPINQEPGGHLRIQWIETHPVEVMKLQPTKEELERIIPSHSARYEWIAKALPITRDGECISYLKYLLHSDRELYCPGVFK